MAKVNEVITKLCPNCNLEKIHSKNTSICRDCESLYKKLKYEVSIGKRSISDMPKFIWGTGKQGVGKRREPEQYKELNGESGLNPKDLNFLYRCSICKIVKKNSEYHTAHSDRNPVRPFACICKECRNKKDNEKDKETQFRRRNQLVKYNLTLEEYNIMLENQNYKCDICKDDLKQLDTRKVHVDHCHSTGKVRGVLCGDCNTGLGRFKDNITILKEAINYLIKNEEKEIENSRKESFKGESLGTILGGSK